MVATMADISVFARTLWERDFVETWKTADALFRRFANRDIPAGAKSVKVPLFGAVVANDWVPGAGADVTLQTGTQSMVEVIADTSKEASVLIDVIEEAQQDVDIRRGYVRAMVNALTAILDAAVLTRCATYTALPAAQIFTTPAAVAATAAAVSTEWERLIMEASVKLDNLRGLGGPPRFCLTDSWIYRYLVGGAAKQSPERTDIPFAYGRGLANPVQGASIEAHTSTAYRAYNVYTNVTTIKGWLSKPDAIAVAPQGTPDLRVTYEGMKRSWLMSNALTYGTKEVVVSDITELRLLVQGNVFGL
jgi:hypothetical protein